MEVRPEWGPATLAAQQRHPGQEGAEPVPGRTTRAPSILGPQCPVWVGGEAVRALKTGFRTHVLENTLPQREEQSEKHQRAS